MNNNSIKMIVIKLLNYDYINQNEGNTFMIKTTYTIISKVLPL